MYEVSTRLLAILPSHVVSYTVANNYEKDISMYRIQQLALSLTLMNREHKRRQEVCAARRRARFLPPCRSHVSSQSFSNNHHTHTVLTLLFSSRRIPFNPFPRCSICFIKLVLYLLNTISSRHEHSRNNKGVCFLSGCFKLLTSFLFETYIPWFARFITPMKGLACA